MDEELNPKEPAREVVPPRSNVIVGQRAHGAQRPGRMPAVYLGHGAPPLVDDPLWVEQLGAWSETLPRPSAILMVSAHWAEAPVTLGATTAGVPLVYDFYGFPQRYYNVEYPAPPAPGLAQRVRDLLSEERIADQPGRGLDHGAYVPLTVMYPRADVPVLQMSMPTLDPWRLMALGRALRPLRDENVLVIGSGFLTHGLPYLSDFRTDAPPPAWSAEFDDWARQALDQNDIDELCDFADRAPGARYAHPTAEHLAPLFVTLGAAADSSPPATTIVDGFWMGLAKRSVQLP